MPHHHEPIVLPVINASNPEVLIFNVKDIQRLREFGILGVLIGTLAQYPQQNFYLSVPLKLQIWEVLWLLDLKVGVLVDYVKYRNAKPQSGKKFEVLLKEGGFVESTLPNFIMIPNDDAASTTIDNNNLNSNDGESDQSLKQIPNTNEIEEFRKLVLLYQISPQEYLEKLEVTPQFISNYLSFKYLKNKGYFISPGLKFGGNLVIYPGDPLKFHSYSIVKFGQININDLVVGGRLATGVKKNFVIIDDVKPLEERTNELQDIFRDPKKQAFSIEWAGFG